MDPSRRRNCCVALSNAVDPDGWKQKELFGVFFFFLSFFFIHQLVEKVGKTL